MGGESGAPLERVPTQKAQQSIASYNSALSRSNDGDVESTGVCPPGASEGMWLEKDKQEEKVSTQVQG